VVKRGARLVRQGDRPRIIRKPTVEHPMPVGSAAKPAAHVPPEAMPEPAVNDKRSSSSSGRAKKH